MSSTTSSMRAVWVSTIIMCCAVGVCSLVCVCVHVLCACVSSSSCACLCAVTLFYPLYPWLHAHLVGGQIKTVFSGVHCLCCLCTCIHYMCASLCDEVKCGMGMDHPTDPEWCGMGMDHHHME